MRLRWLMVWLGICLLMGGLLQPAHQALAFEPKPDYWYIETFSVGEVKLPDGVTILTSDPSSTPRGYLWVENSTQTPLYVMSLNNKDVLVMVTPDPGWKKRLELAHEAAAYLVLPERPAALTMEALTDLDQTLVDPNAMTTNSPPENLAIPPAQRSELLMVYDGQVLEVPFTVSYAVNTRFDNGSAFIYSVMKSMQATADFSATATQQAAMAAARTRDNSLLIGLAAGAVILVGGWLTWKGLTRRG